ncbi:MAG: rod shape-determining protein RodA, partial [Acidimicrobiia bacterium]|nr:rod shape-determining protein RodA [Acidimicrobiia bacterium]
ASVPSAARSDQTLRPDIFLIVPMLVLMALGVVMVYSASAPRLEAQGLDPAFELKRQVAFVVLGVIVFLAASMIGPRLLHELAPIAYVGTLLLLVAVEFVGAIRNQSQRWLDLGVFQLQPSELAKIAVILGLAALLAQAAERITWLFVIRAVVLVGIPAIMVFLQPDLGTMLVFGFLGLVMLYAAGASWRQIASLTLITVFATAALFQFEVIQNYQIERITAFLDPEADAAAAGYNVLQSRIAIGAGGMFGTGLFEGTQTNLTFVPEQSTDFIFTAVGEQLGFVGGALVLVLFAVVVWRLLMTAALAQDDFQRLVAVGVAAVIVFHVFVNVGMTLQIMPVTGLPLPFVSHGGTAMIAMAAGLGIVHGIYMRRSPMPGQARRRPD